MLPLALLGFQTSLVNHLPLPDPQLQEVRQLAFQLASVLQKTLPMEPELRTALDEQTELAAESPSDVARQSA